jgi:hypothetical protein
LAVNQESNADSGGGEELHVERIQLGGISLVEVEVGCLAVENSFKEILMNLHTSCNTCTPMVDIVHKSLIQ